jgi:hypothetical protein
MENNQDDFEVNYDAIEAYDEPTGNSVDIEKEYESGITPPDDLDDSNFDDTTNVSDSDEEVDDSNEPSFEPFINTLEESGLLYLDENKEYEDSEEGFREIIQDTIAHKLQEVSEGIEDAQSKELFEYILKGGKASDYFNTVGETDYSDFTVEDVIANPESHASLVYNYLESQGTLTQNQIEAKINKLIEKDMLEEEATLAFEHLKVSQQKEKEQLFENLQKQKEEESLYNKKLQEDFEREVIGLREIKGLEVTPVEAKQLHAYMTKPVDKNGNSQYQVDIASNLENTFFAAYATMKKLDLKQLVTKGETKAAQKLKEQLSKFSSSGSKENTTRTEKLNKNGDITKDRLVDFI